MLRNVLIITDGGLVLFSKEFVNAVAQPRLVGSLLTAILEFSTNNVGAPVCYIEMSTLAVSICSSRPPMTKSRETSHLRDNFGAKLSSTSPICGHMSCQRSDTSAVTSFSASSATSPKLTRVRTNGSFLICALFHDVDDGPELGRLIAAELLSAFKEQFGTSLAKIGGGTPHINLNEFEAFHGRIGGILRGLVGPVLSRLGACPWVKTAILITDEARITYCSDDGVDSLGLCSNLLALVGLAEDAMGLWGDVLRTVELEGGSGSETRILVRKLRGSKATLVAVCWTSFRRGLSEGAVSRAAVLCEKCFRLMDNLRVQR